MMFKTARYMGSFVDVKACPPGNMPEFAFIGRSNVGKSTLINFLLSKKDLARTSSKPGKTQTINFYQINDSFNFVDLPGYGFAQVSKTKRADWEDMIEGYLLKRDQLACVFQLIDASIPVQQKDIDFTNWMGEHSIPFVLIFTKSDKREKTDSDTVEAYKTSMLESWESIPPVFISAAKKLVGKEEATAYIEEILKGMKVI